MTRTAARPAILLVAAVVANAAVQALLVAAAPALPLSVSGLVVAALSGAALLATAVASWWFTGAGSSRWPRIVLLVTVTGLAAVVTATVAPPLVPLVVAVGCAVVAGGGVGGALSRARREPLRTVLLIVATACAVCIGWVVALLAGLFITGPVAAALTWFSAGALGVAVVVAWRHRGLSDSATRDRI